MTLDEIEAEAKKLDPTSRAALISRLSASLAASPGPSNSAPASPAVPAPPTEEQKEREWLQEALRRSRELRERQIQTEPPDRRPSSAAAAPTVPSPTPPPVQAAAAAGLRPTSKPAPRKKRKTAPVKNAKSSRRPTPRAKSRRPTPRSKSPRGPARPPAKKHAASKTKPKPRPKPSKSQARKKR